MNIKKVNLLKYMLCVIMVGVFSSCEEVIDLDLDSSDSALVIDAEILLNSTANVEISYTTDYYGTEEAEYEEEATVVLTTSKGISEELTYEGDGFYGGSKIIGKRGTEYTLSVTIGDVEYTASSTILTPTSIVSLTPEVSSYVVGSDDYYELSVGFTNNIDEENYYLLKFIYEDEDGSQEQYYTLSWEYFANDSVLEYAGYNVFEEGTVVNVELYSIDEETYEYYSDLDDIDGGSMSGSTPYNPESNFGDDVLGYFRAWSVDEGEVTMTVE